MGVLFGNGNNQPNPPIYQGLNISGSQQTIPVPVGWGQFRSGTNCIWVGDFQKHNVSPKGKGGGGKGSAQYDYTAAVILSAGEGVMDSVARAWADGSTTTVTTDAALGFTFQSGTATQPPWSVVVSKYPLQARAYAYTANFTNPKLDLGSSAVVPDNQFEFVRSNGFAYTPTTTNGYVDPTLNVQYTAIDVLLSDCTSDILTNTQYGVNFGSGSIGSMTLWANYMRAQGLVFSPYLNQQEKLTSLIDRWAGLSNSWIYWSGTQLQFVPLGDTAITANGVTYTPLNDVAYNLSVVNGDFLGTPPIKVARVDEADALNRTQVNFNNRVTGYVTDCVEFKDQTLVDQYGLKDAGSIQADECKNPDVAKIIAQLVGRRAAYIRNTYTFKTSWRFILCLPGTIITLTDPNIGLNQFRVRVREIGENEDGTLNFVCEEYPGTLGTYTGAAANTGAVAVNVPNQLIDPGNINTPAIVEPDSGFTGGVAKLLIAASGGANWGGATVNISFNQTDWQPIGQVGGSAPQGLLTAILPSHVDPDTVNTLSIDATESLTIPSTTVTHADADNNRSLAMVATQPVLTAGVYVMPTNGELLSFGTVTPTSTYTADLTYLRRGRYGTNTSSHAIGDQFTVLDTLDVTGTTLEYVLPPNYIGQTIYFKFTSFNSFTKADQDLSTVNEYSYTPSGVGFGSGTGGVPGLASTPTATGGVAQISLTWVPNPLTDNITGYQVWRAVGPGGAFGSASLLNTVGGPSYTDTGLGTAITYTYFIVAVNAIGAGAHSAGADGITSTVAVSGKLPFGYNVSFIDISTKPLSTVIARIPVTEAFTLPATTSTPFAGTARGKVQVAPSSDTLFDLQKDGVSFAQVKFASGATTATLVNAVDVSFTVTDYIDVVSPSSFNGMSGALGVGFLGIR